MLQGIKNIIFDLGNVIIDLDEAGSTEAFHQLAKAHGKDMEAIRPPAEFFNQFERGEINAVEFLSEFAQRLGGDESLHLAIRAAWNAMLGPIPEAKLNLAEELMEKYRTFVLSNTNVIHVDFINEYLATTYLEESLDPFFHEVFYSHDIRARKPEARAYQFVLDKHKLNPTETLFIDDKAENIQSAEKLGIRGHLLQKPEDLYGIFENR